ncbi:hypothetical protein ACFVXC_38700 [Streptomyces sp. NPDC058257]|uniref:hypothetical protein n=1 Tax=Streptomyces sp. NPDC058257 TaxID=3346409 RepID=UPI0036E24E58
MLIDHDCTGLLGWLPGGFDVVLVAYTAVLAVGVLLTGRSYTRAKALRRRD